MTGFDLFLTVYSSIFLQNRGLSDHRGGVAPGLTHHNSESGLARKPCLLVKFKLLDHLVATFR